MPMMRLDLDWAVGVTVGFVVPRIRIVVSMMQLDTDWAVGVSNGGV